MAGTFQLSGFTEQSLLHPSISYVPIKNSLVGLRIKLLKLTFS